MSRYRSTLQAALAQNSATEVQSLRLPAYSILGALLLALFLAILVTPSERPNYHFLEGGGVTVLSALLMGTAAALAGTAFLLAPKRRWGNLFWLLAAVGFLFFAMDELMEFHERIGRYLDAHLGHPLGFKAWNDVVVVSYGLVAAPVCVIFLPELLRLPNVALMLFAGAAFYALQTGIDSLIPHSQLVLVSEEGCKMFSAGFFALAFLAAVFGMIAVQSTRQPHAPPD